VVGIVANLRPVKDIPFFLDAAAVVAAEILDAAFLVVGTGPLKPQLEAYAVQLGIRERVYFAGRVDNIAELLRTSRWAVSPRWLIGFRTPVLEVYGCGDSGGGDGCRWEPGGHRARRHGLSGQGPECRRVCANIFVGLLRDEVRKFMGRAPRPGAASFSPSRDGSGPTSR